MTRRNAVVRAGMAAAASGLTLLGMAVPASAVDGWVSAESPNGQAYGKTYLNFTSSTMVRFDDIYLNDRCPGDDVRARIELYIRRTGDTGWQKVGEREDIGGCGSDPLRDSTYFSSTLEIDDAGIKVCSKGGCSPMQWNDNPHWVG
ncbi:MAG TPA: hypothetical protein VIB11_03225 [Pedococcus sp.]|uniref:hypothetical protein n=1 Tax=Pedococcus sp. TaxID=2860345 RepID=UPI002F93DCFD